jgi:DNA-binding LacI/PurR family transcriptional regulator
MLLAQLKGMSGQRREAISRLLELALDAQKRYWIALALETKLAAVGLLDEENDPSAAQTRKEVEQAARQHGFGWILARLAPTH